jgi:esterase/lipase superfamily enzyme
MSGVYDLTEYTKGYYDEDVYFNSPNIICLISLIMAF